MTNNIHRDPYQARGMQAMLTFGIGGLVLFGLGLIFPILLTGAGGGDQVQHAVDLGSQAAFYIGAGFLVMAGLSGMFLGPFQHLRHKYGTGSAILMSLPGLLLFAAVIATVALG